MADKSHPAMQFSDWGENAWLVDPKDGASFFGLLLADASLKESKQPKLSSSLVSCPFYVFQLDTRYSPPDVSELREVLMGKDAGRALKKPEGFGFSLDHPCENIRVLGPRRGASTPFGDKARDILHNSGYSMVLRVEKLMWHRVKGRAGVAGVQIRKPEQLHLIQMSAFESDYAEISSSSPSTKRRSGAQISKSEWAHLMQLDLLLHSRWDTPLQACHDLMTASSHSPVMMHYNVRKDTKEIKEFLGRPPLEVELEHWQKWSNHNHLDRETLTDVELMMFEQANSEHCRHHIFRARWKAIAKRQKSDNESLFDMIRATSQDPESRGLISCYSDNAAVFTGYGESHFAPDKEGVWCAHDKKVHLVAKAETHNHPTGISPWPGAGTGVGGELRDEAAVGRGATSRAGLSGYMVSDLGLERTRDTDNESLRNLPKSPPKVLLAGPREIMCHAPLGAAAYGNEFGRPLLNGFFRTLELMHEGQRYGYDKPLMLAGGMGHVVEGQAFKAKVKKGDKLVVLGGPGMRIGIGGGAASSSAGGSGNAAAYASVQRSYPEMQRRCQEVIDACSRLGEENPILFIHDVGAGGLSNAVPELLNDAGVGAVIRSENIPVAETGMDPWEVWCNESQERFVLAVDKKHWKAFEDLCQRERCHFSVLADIDKKPRLRIERRPTDADKTQGDMAWVDIHLDWLFKVDTGSSRKLSSWEEKGTDKLAESILTRWLSNPFELKEKALKETVHKIGPAVLSHPAVASKAFIITIADRSVGGLVARDQMVGPRQVPVADCAITLSSHLSNDGEAMATAERPAVALLNPEASVRLALGEAVTNMLAAPIKKVEDIRLSANWMAACGQTPDLLPQDAALHAGVSTLSKLCCELGIAIPVGKDSLSMRSNAWKDIQQMRSKDKSRKKGSSMRQATWFPRRTGEAQEVLSPMTLALSAFAPVRNVHQAWIPEIRMDEEGKDSCLVRLQLGDRKRLGGSILDQLAPPFGVTNAKEQVEDLSDNLSSSSDDPEAHVGCLSGHPPADLDNPEALKVYVALLCQARQENKVLAYHDVSDGGLFACLCEMAFSGGCGVDLDASRMEVQQWEELVAWLFNEELGCVLQIRNQDYEWWRKQVGQTQGCLFLERLGKPTSRSKKSGSTYLRLLAEGELLLDWTLESFSGEKSEGEECLYAYWTRVSDSVRIMRTPPERQRSVRQERRNWLRGHYRLTPEGMPTVSRKPSSVNPALRVAVIREQGTNGAAEIAAAVTHAGMRAVDIHMTDLISGKKKLDDFRMVVFCGGFSYGDVLGAGHGWATSILHHKDLRKQFKRFFCREDSLTLGVCNGCQVLSELRELIPDASDWPDFIGNKSTEHEARWVQVRVPRKAKVGHIWLQGMEGAVIPVPVSHGEGQACFESIKTHKQQIALRYVGAQPWQGCGESSSVVGYPSNPNGSERHIAGVTAADGRIFALMPHPERAVRYQQWSWRPPGCDATGFAPWQLMFDNAAKWLSSN